MKEIANYIQNVSTRTNQHSGDLSQGDWFLRELARDRGFDGYDAIDVGAKIGRPKYMVILNRTVVRVENESVTGVE